MPAFTDQYVTPTRAGYAAEVVLALLEDGAGGVFHVASRECVTPYEFAEMVIENVGVVGPELIVEGSLDDVGRPAPRPVDTCLSTTRKVPAKDEAQSTLMDEVIMAISVEQ